MCTDKGDLLGFPVESLSIGHTTAAGAINEARMQLTEVICRMVVQAAIDALACRPELYRAKFRPVIKVQREALRVEELEARKVSIGTDIREFHPLVSRVVCVAAEVTQPHFRQLLKAR